MRRKAAPRHSYVADELEAAEPEAAPVQDDLAGEPTQSWHCTDADDLCQCQNTSTCGTSLFVTTNLAAAEWCSKKFCMHSSFWYSVLRSYSSLCMSNICVPEDARVLPTVNSVKTGDRCRCDPCKRAAADEIAQLEAELGEGARQQQQGAEGELESASDYPGWSGRAEAVEEASGPSLPLLGAAAAAAGQ